MFQALTVVGEGERPRWEVDERGTAVEVVGAGSLGLEAGTIKGEGVDAVRVVGSGSRLSAKASSALRSSFSRALVVSEGGMAVLEEQCTVRDNRFYGVYLMPTVMRKEAGVRGPFVSMPAACVQQH